MFRYPLKPPRSRTAAKPGFRPRPRQQESDSVYRVFLSLVLLAFAGRVLFGCIGAIGGFQPMAQVGDQLIFAPQAAGAVKVAAKIPARLVTSPWSSPGRACLLDTAAMTRPGGVMTVLAVRQDGVMLSWAGGATALVSAACRGGQSVLVADDNYLQLVAAQKPLHSSAK